MSDLKYLPVTTTVTVVVLGATLRKTSEIEKKNLSFTFHFRVQVTSVKPTL